MASTNSNLIEHLPCHACRYDLHALASDGHCPECGAAIAESLRRSHEIRDSSPAFLAVSAAMVGLFSTINLIHANFDPAGVGIYFAIWILTLPVSLLAGILCLAQREMAGAVFCGGLFFLALLGAGLNAPLALWMG